MMSSLETVVLSLVSILPVAMAIDERVRPTGVFRSIAYALMSFGGLVALGCSNYLVLELGVLVRFFERSVYMAYLRRRCKLIGLIDIILRLMLGTLYRR